MSVYLKFSRVGRNENLFILFQNGNKNCRVGTKKSGSIGLEETQLFFLFGLNKQSKMAVCFNQIIAVCGV